jgi:glycerol kinase
MAEVIAAMDLQNGGEAISIDGGMVANSYFCQFLADILGRELIVSSEPELTALGAAALAAEAVGLSVMRVRNGRRVSPMLTRATPKRLSGRRARLSRP